jgi:ribosomal-protein-alanine N-acetyltransferase
MQILCHKFPLEFAESGRYNEFVTIPKMNEKGGEHMRKYTDEHVLEQVVCNACGRNLLVEDGILKEDILEGKKTFGYFSKKDGIVEQFDICEECYERIKAAFIVPVQESEQLTLL